MIFLMRAILKVILLMRVILHMAFGEARGAHLTASLTILPKVKAAS